MKNGISTGVGVIVLLLVAALAFGGAFAYKYYVEGSNSQFLNFQNLIPQPNNQTAEPVACTMEAKQCPDGSYVGRTGPNCEFAECPSLDNY